MPPTHGGLIAGRTDGRRRTPRKVDRMETITCLSCGTLTEISDASANSGKCTACGRVLSQQPPQKACSVCGIVVSHQRRTKDAQGRYYCQPCWSTKVQDGTAWGATQAGSIPASDTAELPRVDSLEAQPVDLQTPARHICHACGGVFDAEDMFSDFELYICETCLDQCRLSRPEDRAAAPANI